jgi:predicted RNA-binding protein with PIN domain
VRVLFSAADEIADALIARLVEAEPVGRTVVVVSSDGEVAAHARSRGAQAAASQLLLDRLAQLR